MPKIIRTARNTAPVDQNTKGGLAPEAEVPVKLIMEESEACDMCKLSLFYFVFVL